MTLQLRQICLVAAQLAPVISNLTEIFGIKPCYVDPGVGVFGLENTLMPIGRNFLEVVAPIQEGTAAGRYLDRRGGDGGYMVITQADSKAAQQTARQRALDQGVRIAHETERDNWHLIQFHPGDLQAAFLEIETDAQNDFNGHWMPVGGTGWEAQVDQHRTLDFLGVELQCTDPQALAEKWSGIIGVRATHANNAWQVALNNAQLSFIELTDNRGPGLSGIHLRVADKPGIQRDAAARGCLVTDSSVTVGGVHWHLHA